MKRFVLVLLLLASLAGCLASEDGGDGDASDGPTHPVEPVDVEQVTAMEFLAAPKFNDSASPATLGEWVEDGLAYLSGGAGLRIVDIHDPANPVVLAQDVPDTNSRDVDLIHHPNGHLYAILADSGESNMKLVDVTDPRDPVLVTTTTTCVHTVAVVPNSTVVYGSWSLCHAFVPGQPLDGDVEIVDFADPMHPVSKLFVFPPVIVDVGGTPREITATSCHEMTFNAELHRAYCAAISDTQVWDTTDPLNPVIQQVIDDPLVNIHHSVWDADNGTTLILGDEFTGVLAPTPMCSTTASYPTSALWFYDISDLGNPVRKGYYQIPFDSVQHAAENGGLPEYCSTHLGDVIDGHDLIVMGWYSAGTALIDFSDLQDPSTVATWRAADPTSVWETRYYDGHIYVSDERHGLDILTLVTPQMEA